MMKAANPIPNKLRTITGMKVSRIVSIFTEELFVDKWSFYFKIFVKKILEKFLSF